VINDAPFFTFKDFGPHHWNPYVKIFINRFFVENKIGAETSGIVMYFKMR